MLSSFGSKCSENGISAVPFFCAFRIAEHVAKLIETDLTENWAKEKGLSYKLQFNPLI